MTLTCKTQSEKKTEVHDIQNQSIRSYAYKKRTGKTVSMCLNPNCKHTHRHTCEDRIAQTDLEQHLNNAAPFTMKM